MNTTLLLQRMAAGALSLALLASLAACGGAATTPPAAQAPAGAAQAGPNTCADLQSAIAEILKVEVALSDADFQDVSSGSTLPGCQLSAKGTGVQFSDFVALSQELSAVLVAHGWEEDPRAAADGPTGTVIGFKKNQQPALLRVEWTAAPEANCPADQIITECEILPEQKLYTIRLNAAKTAATLPVATAEFSAEEEELKQTVYTYVMENTEVRQFEVELNGFDGDYARARVVPQDDSTMPAFVFAQQTSGSHWMVIGIGTGFDPDWYSEHNVPRSLWVGNS